MKKRSIASLIILTIVTCGIYSLYWFVVTTDDIEDALGSKSDGSCPNGGICLLLSILTCGIYSLYWYYKEAQRLQILSDERGIRSNTEGWIYILLCLFGLELVSMAIMQDQLNRIAETPVIVSEID